MLEQWIAIVGYGGLYSISNLGNVRANFSCNNNQYKAGRILRLRKSINGYLRVGLYKERKQKWFSVALLVAHAFVGVKPEGLQVNHRDGNKLNNQASNLEYVTPSENLRHAFCMGLSKATRGSKNPGSKLTEEKVISLRNDYRGGLSYSLLSAKYDVGANQIWRIINRRQWKHV